MTPQRLSIEKRLILFLPFFSDIEGKEPELEYHRIEGVPEWTLLTSFVLFARNRLPVSSDPDWSDNKNGILRAKCAGITLSSLLSPQASGSVSQTFILRHWHKCGIWKFETKTTKGIIILWPIQKKKAASFCFCGVFCYRLFPIWALTRNVAYPGLPRTKQTLFFLFYWWY